MRVSVSAFCESVCVDNFLRDGKKQNKKFSGPLVDSTNAREKTVPRITKAKEKQKQELKSFD